MRKNTLTFKSSFCKNFLQNFLSKWWGRQKFICFYLFFLGVRVTLSGNMLFNMLCWSKYTTAALLPLFPWHGLEVNFSN